MIFDIFRNANGSYTVTEHDASAEFFGGIVCFAAVLLIGMATHPAWCAGIIAYTAVSVVLALILRAAADLEKAVKIRVYGNVARFLIAEAAMYIFGSIDLGVIILLTLISSGRVMHKTKQMLSQSGPSADSLRRTAKYVSLATMAAAICSMYIR